MGLVDDDLAVVGHVVESLLAVHIRLGGWLTVTT